VGGRVAHLWRHPIKGHGVEAVAATELAAGATMPWDRVWAIAHDAARVVPDDAAWVPCANFCRGARTPALMAIRAVVDEARGRVRLTHPEREPIEVDPDDPADRARLVAWVTPLGDPGRAQTGLRDAGGPRAHRLRFPVDLGAQPREPAGAVAAGRA
jgi:uncharacterized protein